jgi:hypothetical protein
MTHIPYLGGTVLVEYPLRPASGIGLLGGREALPVPGELQLQIHP